MERNNLYQEVSKKLLSCNTWQMEAQEQQRGHSPEGKTLQVTEAYRSLSRVH